MHKVIELMKINLFTLIGIILGILVYIKSKDSDYGEYNIGLSKYFEYSLIPIYMSASLYSTEIISKTLLACEAGFHIGVLFC